MIKGGNSVTAGTWQNLIRINTGGWDYQPTQAAQSAANQDSRGRISAPKAGGRRGEMPLQCSTISAITERRNIPAGPFYEPSQGSSASGTGV